ncbi:hypothetical protein QE152_g9364 [Popillia japonica]|uniref:Uncharacterized protein n=1 Tax=Popillia japonica TaxID=7064 RepID=A0AAW1LUV9_POPJA
MLQKRHTSGYNPFKARSDHTRNEVKNEVKREKGRSFSKNVEINTEDFNILFHVVPKEVSNFKVILGCNLLEQADAHVGEDGIVVCRKDKDSFLMRIAVDEKNLEEIELDLEHVKNPEHREMVTELVETYQPQKTKTTDIQMRIILNNEGPVYNDRTS